MNPYKYERMLKPGKFQTVMIADTNYVDATFAASDSPKMYDILDEKINNDFDDIIEKYSRPRLDDLSIGTACLVKYLDQRFYRAFIMQESEYFGEKEVYFVDYGNVWSTLPINIYVIDQSILEIPVAIYRCKLIDVDDSTPTKRNMIASYIKEMTNIEQSFATIDVIKVEGIIHHVKLFHHSMEQFLYFNDFINPLIAQVIDEADEAKVNIKKASKFKNKPEVPRQISFTEKPSNYDAASQLVSRVFNSKNVLNDDDVPLLPVMITNIVSPFEFYAVPELIKTKVHYRLLFEELTAENAHESPGEFELPVPSELLAYHNIPKKSWRRGKVVKATQSKELGKLYEYTILDYDDVTIYKPHILKENICKHVHLLAQKFYTKPQAIHCVIPNYFFKNPEESNEQGVEFLENYIRLHPNNLFVLPLSEAKDEGNKFVVNLYDREMILTGLFEAKKQFFGSYIDKLCNKFNDQVIHFSQASLPFKFDFKENIYRNLSCINMFDVDDGDDDEVPNEKSHYKRVLYPNTCDFSGQITYYNSQTRRLCFRYDSHDALYQQVLEELEKLAKEEKEGKLHRIEKTLEELYPCVVLENPENHEAWHRCEILSIIEQKQAPWLPRIKVRLVDVGRIAMYYIEDLRDFSVAPNVPMLAVPSLVVGHLISEVILQNSAGKKANLKWINFPSLPMNVYIESIVDT